MFFLEGWDVFKDFFKGNSRGTEKLLFPQKFYVPNDVKSCTFIIGKFSIYKSFSFIFA
jgi:hypothetical protein